MMAFSSVLFCHFAISLVVPQQQIFVFGFFLPIEVTTADIFGISRPFCPTLLVFQACTISVETSLLNQSWPHPLPYHEMKNNVLRISLFCVKLVLLYRVCHNSYWQVQTYIFHYRVVDTAQSFLTILVSLPVIQWCIYK